MAYTFLLFSFLTAGVQTAKNQPITEPARASAARDSLLRATAATRLEATQRTGFVLTTSRQGKRKHVVRGFQNVANPQNLPENRLKKNLIWKQKTIYRRNGQVLETYVAQLGNRKVLQETKLNDNTLWIKLSQPTNLANAAKNTEVVEYEYMRGGYFTWRGQQYAQPKQ